MRVLDWIITNPVMALVILVILIAICVLIYINRKDVILKSALYIVAKVEEEWGSDMGKVKFAEAYTYIKAKYPIVTFLLPESVLFNYMILVIHLKAFSVTQSS